MKDKLPKKFKDKWVKALMSGKYEQGTMGHLKDTDNKYCCLGVACVVVGAVPTNGFISKSVKGYLKVPKILHDLEKDTIPLGLADMNDAGVPFEVIAGFINENL